MVAFTAEMISKINHKGLWDTSSTLEASNDDNKLAYLKDRWCQVLIDVIINNFTSVKICQK